MTFPPALGFAGKFSSGRQRAAHTRAAQAGCCGLRMCCIHPGRVFAGLREKNVVSVMERNEV